MLLQAPHTWWNYKEGGGGSLVQQICLWWIMLPMMTLEILSLSPWLPLRRTGKNRFCMFLCFRQPLFDVDFGSFFLSANSIPTAGARLLGCLFPLPALLFSSPHSLFLQQLLESFSFLIFFEVPNCLCIEWDFLFLAHWYRTKASEESPQNFFCPGIFLYILFTQNFLTSRL